MTTRRVVVLALLLVLLVGVAPPQAHAQSVVLKNPSFDQCTAGTATFPDDWPPGSPPAGCSTNARTGVYALQLKQYGSVRQDVTVASAGVLTFSVWVRLAYSAYDYRLGVGNSTTCTLYAPTAGAVWQQAQCSALVSAGVATVAIYAPSFVGSPGLLFDDAQVVVVPPTPTPSATSTPTATAVPTSTSTPTATSTPTLTPTGTSTATATAVPSPTGFPVYCPVVVAHADAHRVGAGAGDDDPGAGHAHAHLPPG